MPEVIEADHSVILFDSDDNGGVDVYYSVYGQTGQKTGNVLVTIPAPAPPPGWLVPPYTAAGWLCSSALSWVCMFCELLLAAHYW